MVLLPPALRSYIVSICCWMAIAFGAPALADTPLVFAHYMHCYVLGAYPSSDSRVQNPRAVEDLANWPPLDLESSWYSSELAEIASAGEAAALKEFSLFDRAGLDAIGLLLGPRVLPESQFSRGLHLVATTAARSRTKIIPELWIDDPWREDLATFGRVIKEFMDAHPNAFLSRQGKPLFVLGFDASIARKMHDPRTAPIARIAELFEPWGGLQGIYLISYVQWELDRGLKSPLVQASSAIGIWTPEDDWSARHSGVVFEVSQSLRKDVAFPVSPAFYQRRAGQPPMEYGNSFGAARYLDAWRRAIAKSPSFVNIQTWNDFSEDSAVVPTNTAGSAWLHLTSYFTKWLRDNREPAIDTERVMLFRPKQLVNAGLANPRDRVSNHKWRHGSPTVDYISVVTMLRHPATVRVRLGAQIWEKRIQAGLRDWVIYASSSPEANSSQTVVPTSSETRYVTVARAFEADTPIVEVTKNSESTEKLTSKLPFLSSGEWQDFTIVADELTLGAD